METFFDSLSNSEGDISEIKKVFLSLEITTVADIEALDEALLDRIAVEVLAEEGTLSLKQEVGRARLKRALKEAAKAAGGATQGSAKYIDAFARTFGSTGGVPAKLIVSEKDAAALDKDLGFYKELDARDLGDLLAKLIPFLLALSVSARTANIGPAMAHILKVIEIAGLETHTKNFIKYDSLVRKRLGERARSRALSEGIPYREAVIKCLAELDVEAYAEAMHNNNGRNSADIGAGKGGGKGKGKGKWGKISAMCKYTARECPYSRKEGGCLFLKHKDKA
jgi:hypothetical protein